MYGFCDARLISGRGWLGLPPQPAGYVDDSAVAGELLALLVGPAHPAHLGDRKLDVVGLRAPGIGDKPGVLRPLPVAALGEDARALCVLFQVWHYLTSLALRATTRRFERDFPGQVEGQDGLADTPAGRHLRVATSLILSNRLSKCSGPCARRMARTRPYSRGL